MAKFPHLESIKSLGVVGATGLVGNEFIDLLNEHKIKIPKIRLFASENSRDKTVEIAGEEVEVEPLTEMSFRGLDAVFFSVPTDVTQKYVPFASKSGAVSVVDSGVYRMDPNIALVVPEVNGEVLRDYAGKVVSIPNCSTTPLVLTLKPLLDLYGIQRVVVSTYQSVSGVGRSGYEELSLQTALLLNGKEATMEVFPHRIAFNCLPKIGKMTDSGDTEEEVKVLNESRKILGVPGLKISCTAVRIPTFFCHGLSVNVQLKNDFKDTSEIQALLDKSPGLKVIDHPEHDIYPTGVDASGSNDTLVGRIRRDTTVPFGLNYWIIADNLRKGAALNGLQILDTLYRYRRMS